MTPAATSIPIPLVPRMECSICGTDARKYLVFRDPALGEDGNFCRDCADEHLVFERAADVREPVSAAIWHSLEGSAA